MGSNRPDFGGYATKYNIKCSDGRTIGNGAFAHQDGEVVPLVWNHQRNTPDNIIGNAHLEGRDDGIYCNCSFNNTEKGKLAKALVEHGDIKHLSIYANQLLEKSKNVMHGQIREVSLVLAGANKGAVIDNVCIVHSDGSVEDVEGEAVIYSGEEIEMSDFDDNIEELEEVDDIEHADESDSPTAREVLKSMNDDQKTLMYAMIEHALSSVKENDDEDGGNEMKKNVFEQADAAGGPSLSHADQAEILENARKYEYNSFAKYVTNACLEHGITDIDFLFDEAQLIRDRPDMIARDQEWVAKVYDAASKSPFSHIKSMAANLTADEARAKGYIKGKKKVDEQFSLLKRTTTPQTIYKKQSFDRDDIADINSFDVIAWIKSEMKMMLREEAARAILVGDGRLASSDDKINPQNIRPIYGDSDTYVIYKTVTMPADGNYTDTANAVIDSANYARIDYKGSGNTVLFTTSKIMTDLSLAKDKNGRRLYNTKAEIASALRVNDIVEVPVMDGVTRTTTGGATMALDGIILNMKDYTVGATKMGQTTMFENFDIDYNKQKYLIETRMAGALTMPYSAIVLEHVVTNSGSSSGSGEEAAG